MAKLTDLSTNRLERGDAHLYPDSRADVDLDGNPAVLVLERGVFGKRLLLAAPPTSAVLERLEGVPVGTVDSLALLRCPLNEANAAQLRIALPDLAPRPLGLATSAGFGDRLGIATPGHARALHSAGASGGVVAPIFAQQSIREMTRTRRSPAEVLRDATFGAFEVGWRGPLGADADHLKRTEDIDACADVGYSFFTVDPGDHVDDDADTTSVSDLERRLDALPWERLETTREALEKAYVDRIIDLDNERLALSREQVLRGAAKYGAALAHVVRMYRHLTDRRKQAFDFEVSVDETGTPTSAAEHAFIALELKRLGVSWVSLAPRFPGRFEKGVDYIGDVDVLTLELKRHAAIARALGPYKLSLHSGSDKFLVYGPFTRATGSLAHLKTAGTSYLEALRVIADVTPALFREVLAFARVRYSIDRASYHISARLEKVADGSTLSDEDLPGLLDQLDARQVLHVTFGSVLEAYGYALQHELRAHEEEHYAALDHHFVKHLRPFVEAAR